MMCGLGAGEGEVTCCPAIPDTAPLKVNDVRLVVDEGSVSFRLAITNTAPLDVSDERSGGCEG
jgi:hypothetical protein